MKRIYIHSDDYAISVNASKDILRAIDERKIDSISILPNMSCFEDCINMLKDKLKDNYIKISVHINLIEGKCVSDKNLVYMLVDKNGYFKHSWINLFKYSYSFAKRELIKKQLKIEIKNQIEKIRRLTNKKIRIDSHQHTHMLPIVFEALMEVIDEENYEVEYIRVSQEPLVPYIKEISLYKTYSIMKIISNIILNIYARKIKKILINKKISFGSLWGVVMSGKMDIERIKKLEDDMIKVALRKNDYLEILFHIGSVLEEEITSEYTKKDFIKFHL